MTTNESVGDIFSKKIQSKGNSYDEVPYKSFAFAQTHPRRLATVARIMGIETPPLETCRVLELACSGGGNLLPMAEQLPGGHFVGIDLSKVAIDEATHTAELIGLKNVQLHQKDILEVTEELGEFDYIIAHGVFSWVPLVVREKILDICRKQLSPNGVAYISYNTNPGWRLRGTIRDVMRYRSQFFNTPDERLREARSLVNFLAKCAPADGTAYGRLLNDELSLIQGGADYYLLHEFLEDDNDPMYFHEFVELARRHELQYVGEAEYSSMSVNNFGPEVAKMLQSISSDVVQREQYLDFVRNRTFRQTLLCHQGRTVNHSPTAEVVKGMYVTSAAEPNVKTVNLASDDPVRFLRAKSAMTTKSPLIKTVMWVMRERFPELLPFSEMMRLVRERLASLGVNSTNSPEKDDQTVAEMLLHAYSTMVADLVASPWQAGYDIPAKPIVSPLARHQALTTGMPANRGHAPCQLNGFQAFVVTLCDGEHDRERMIDELYEQSREELRLSDNNGQLITDVGQIRGILGTILDEALRHIATQGLLAP